MEPELIITLSSIVDVLAHALVFYKPLCSFFAGYWLVNVVCRVPLFGEELGQG